MDEINMKRILITGGAGFIGSHFVEKLLDDRGVEMIMVYDNLSSGSLSRIEKLMVDRRVFFCKGDIRQTDKLRSMMCECDTVIHLAANADISKAAENPAIDFYESTVLLQEVLECMRWNGVKNLIYASGSGVYGDNGGVEPFKENHSPLTPVSPYGANKLACEALITAYAHMFKIRATIGRFANVVGPRQTHGVGYDFIKRLKQDPTKLKILGDGTQTKSYIHVWDVVDAMLAANSAVTTNAAEFSDFPFLAIFNVATKDSISVNQIAAMAATVLGIDPASIQYEYTGGRRGWSGDVPCIRMDSDRIRYHTGWSETMSSKGAMRSALLSLSEELK